MARAPVTNVVHLPGGEPVVDLQVVATLFPSATQAYDPTGTAIGAAEQAAGDGNGAWSLSLERTDTMTPSGAVYQVTESSRTTGYHRTSYIIVPAGGGTLEALLTVPPGSIPPFNAVTAVLAGTNVTVDNTNPQRPRVSAITGGGTRITFPQTTPSAAWHIVHNLNTYPTVTVVDSSGDEVEGDVIYTDTNTVDLSFAGAFAGTAYLF